MNSLLLPPSRLARSVLRTQSDDRLTELARGGSEAAFEALVARYRRPLVRHCRRVTGDADAEEAVQNALVRAHRAIGRGDEVRNVGAWLHTIAHNAALNVLRARNARLEYPHDDHARALNLAHDPAEHRQEFRELIAAVQALPLRQRDAIVMRELEGRSYEEIALALGTSHGAVRQLLNRARHALRDRIGAFTGAEPLLRWLLGGGGGATAARLGALGGGCAVTAKLCATALLPATILGVAQAPSSRARTRSAAASSAAPSATATKALTTTTTTTTTASRASSATPARELWRLRSTPPATGDKVRVTGTAGRAPTARTRLIVSTRVTTTGPTSQMRAPAPQAAPTRQDTRRETASPRMTASPQPIANPQPSAIAQPTPEPSPPSTPH